MIGLILWLAMAAAPPVPATAKPAHATAKPAPAPAKPAPAPAKPRTGPASALIHSETFKRPFNDQPQTFRVDYTASLNWSLADRKACFFHRCHMVCDMTFTHKVLSRQLWWTPPGKPAVLAENNPSQREYFGGLVELGRPCAEVKDADVAHAAADRLRPYQFADEMIKDRPLLLKAVDDYLAINPPEPVATNPPPK